jgi:hypothetical protein
MNTVIRPRLSHLIIPVLAVLIASGCATTKGSYHLVNPPNDYLKIAKLGDLVVEVNCNNDIPLSPYDKDRIMNLIVQNIRKEYPQRFKTISPTIPGAGTLYAAVMIKRYDEGSAFARFMLAGLGQMHIDADVALANGETKEPIAKYEVSKTFAWGGAYGGSTGIRDIEDGFAKAVAACISERKASR